MERFMKLLIVEDNPGMRRLIKSVVFDLVNEILECEDGTDALRTYIDFQPDWVLMDIKMQFVDGITATQNIINSFPDANICIVSDYGDKKTMAAASKAGAKGYVVKQNLYSIRELFSR